MTTARLLMIDDDARLSTMVGDYLRANGYEVDTAGSLAAGRERLRQLSYDALVLDLMLPDGDGLDLTRELRADARTKRLPLLMLTARGEPLDRVLGLELGADDYLSKPVEPRRLLARIRALLRRNDGDTPQSVDGSLQFGQFSISQATREATMAGETMELTTAEFDLLWLLACHAGEILSRDDIMNALRGIGFDGLDRSIDARISRLRKKLGDNPETPTRIKTVRGKGYLFSRSDWE